MTTVSHPASESRRAAAARAAAALRTETGLARLALGVGALHVVDDNFLQPQPGTSAGDHLVGGLIQTALFVLAAWAYPRLRPGAVGAAECGLDTFRVGELGAALERAGVYSVTRHARSDTPGRQRGEPLGQHTRPGAPERPGRPCPARPARL